MLFLIEVKIVLCIGSQFQLVGVSSADKTLVQVQISYRKFCERVFFFNIPVYFLRNLAVFLQARYKRYVSFRNFVLNRYKCLMMLLAKCICSVKFCYTYYWQEIGKSIG
jgi:hypothetical protein